MSFLARKQSFCISTMGQKLIQLKATFLPARHLAPKHGHRFLPEILGLWEKNFGEKKVADPMKMAVEFFSKRKERQESVADFCTQKIHVAGKLKPTLLDTES